MSESFTDLLITKVREEKSELEAKLQIAIDALKDIANNHDVSESTDTAREALKKLGFHD